MADYSVLDNGSNLVLEVTLVSWQEMQSQFNIAIRPKGQTGSASWPQAQVFLPMFLVPDLLANLSDPNSAGLVQTNDRLSGAGTIGRFNSDFTISNNSGTGRVVLNESQWKNTIDCLNRLYLDNVVIKSIGRCFRMHLINIVRELGLDNPQANGGRFKTTQWYDYRYDSPKNYPGGSGNGGSVNYQNNNGIQQNGSTQQAHPNSVDDASYRTSSAGFSSNGRSGFNGGVNNTPSYPANHPAQPHPAPMGMPAGTAMPTMPSGITQQVGMNNPVPGMSTNPGSSIPMGRPMPTLPDGGGAQSGMGVTSAMAGSIQDMLNSTFRQE